ncbi:MAG: alanyl-tRNA editing protein [Anaerolineae bacterium]|nr:alanyl-tRNA editing protein [Anaerolineae bacterium]
MTERLYYADAYIRSFEAHVIEHLDVDGRPAVVLDRTGFYPTGGGQPCDLGTIDDVEVVDVLSRPIDHAVLHVLAGKITADTVSCRIDWALRLDHMQHHTGQHILTRAFADVANAHTVSFHLSPDSVTIDLDVPHIPPDMVAEVEDFANRIVFENRRVTARIVDANEADRLNARKRKLPDYLDANELRVIEIEGLDVTACGGTHVSRTGEIGLIKVLKLERSVPETRVEFRCGMRALRDYQLKNTLVSQLATDLTVGVWEVGQAIARLNADLKEARSMLKEAQARLLDHEADSLLAASALHGDIRVVRAVFEKRDVADLRALAARFAGTPATVILLGAAGEKAQVVLARSQDLPYDMSDVLKQVLAALGTDRGGGRPDFAQGGGVAATVGEIEAVLRDLEQGLFL